MATLHPLSQFDSQVADHVALLEARIQEIKKSSYGTNEKYEDWVKPASPKGISREDLTKTAQYILAHNSEPSANAYKHNNKELPLSIHYDSTLGPLIQLKGRIGKFVGSGSYTSNQFSIQFKTGEIYSNRYPIPTVKNPEEIDPVVLAAINANPGCLHYTEEVTYFHGKAKATRASPFHPKGNLITFIHPKNANDVTWIPNAFLQLLKHFLLLHEAGIAHRDFKPENIIVTNDKRLLLADPFTAVKTKDSLDIDPAGTIDFLPPDILYNSLCIYSAEQLLKGDVFAIGITLQDFYRTRVFNYNLDTEEGKEKNKQIRELIILLKTPSYGNRPDLKETIRKLEEILSPPKRPPEKPKSILKPFFSCPFDDID